MQISTQNQTDQDLSNLVSSTKSFTEWLKMSVKAVDLHEGVLEATIVSAELVESSTNKNYFNMFLTLNSMDASNPHKLYHWTPISHPYNNMMNLAKINCEILLDTFGHDIEKISDFIGRRCHVLVLNFPSKDNPIKYEISKIGKDSPVHVLRGKKYDNTCKDEESML